MNNLQKSLLVKSPFDLLLPVPSLLISSLSLLILPFTVIQANTQLRAQHWTNGNIHPKKKNILTEVTQKLIFLLLQTLFFCKWKFCRKQNRVISFHPLLPLPKRIQQGLIAWILFVSLFFLYQKNKGLNAWDIFCLPFTKIQRTNRLRTLS